MKHPTTLQPTIPKNYWEFSNLNVFEVSYHE